MKALDFWMYSTFGWYQLLTWIISLWQQQYQVHRSFHRGDPDWEGNDQLGYEMRHFHQLHPHLYWLVMMR